MSQTLARVQSARTQVGATDLANREVLTHLGLKPGDPRSAAAVAVAKHYDLDPLLKHVIVIPNAGVYITRDGLLHVAHRSGQLDGIVVDVPPMLTDDGTEWVCQVTVWRKDMSHGFTFPGRYPVAGKNRQYAPEMALARAESHALRRAFSVSLPTTDERDAGVDEPWIAVDPAPEVDPETGEVIDAFPEATA